ncbi:glycoside hydrolase family 53 protein [Selenomonas montiformis]|uniref:glycoside hydrolase family 53 protein n=1 Tax=Selenomonas montiformis TaxID=2652285 RepID=UPI003F88C463
MKLREWKKMLAAAAVLVLAAAASPAEAAVSVDPVPGMTDSFIRGADVSMLPDLEKAGVKFYDMDGTQMDELAIMKKYGVNWIRLRIWNHPSQGGGGGAMNAKKALGVAKRAHALGMKVLLDFHYSDTWADPGHQITPNSWKNHNIEQLKADVHDFTRETLEYFADEDELPEMVQIGNEITNGMLWPVGQLPAKDDGRAFAGLVEAGLSAVHELDKAHAVKTMIHIDRGGDNALYHRFFDQLITRNGVHDFDVIGVSFYPFWNGRAKALEENLTDISARYGKEVCVAETAYGFTLDNYDRQGNLFTAKEAGMGGYRVSPQGQAQAVRDVMAAVAAVPDGRGIGVFYWEPDWVAIPDAVRDNQLTGWENLALFDKNGRALESWKVFSDVQSR